MSRLKSFILGFPSIVGALPRVPFLPQANPVAIGAQVPRIERLVEIGCEDCGDARQLAANSESVVIPSGAAQRRSRGILALLTESPLPRGPRIPRLAVARSE